MDLTGDLKKSFTPGMRVAGWLAGKSMKRKLRKFLNREESIFKKAILLLDRIQNTRWRDLRVMVSRCESFLRNLIAEWS